MEEFLGHDVFDKMHDHLFKDDKFYSLYVWFVIAGLALPIFFPALPYIVSVVMLLVPAFPYVKNMIESRTIEEEFASFVNDEFILEFSKSYQKQMLGTGCAGVAENIATLAYYHGHGDMVNTYIQLRVMSAHPEIFEKGQSEES